MQPEVQVTPEQDSGDPVIVSLVLENKGGGKGYDIFVTGVWLQSYFCYEGDGYDSIFIIIIISYSLLKTKGGSYNFFYY